MSRRTIIVYNPGNELAGEVYRKMCHWFKNRGFSVMACDSHNCGTLEQTPDAEFAVSLGGDGTFLSCARLLAGTPIPILPVHLGTFGFITEVTHNEWQEALEAWLDGRLVVENRMVLDVSVLRNGTHIAGYKSVNDAVVSTSGISKLVRLSLEIEGFDGGHFRGTE